MLGGSCSLRSWRSVRSRWPPVAARVGSLAISGRRLGGNRLGRAVMELVWVLLSRCGLFWQSMVRRWMPWTLGFDANDTGPLVAMDWRIAS